MCYAMHVASLVAPAGKMPPDKAHRAKIYSVSCICCLQMMTSVLMLLRLS